MALDQRETSPLTALATSPLPIPSSPPFLPKRRASLQTSNDQPADDQHESSTSIPSSPPSSSSESSSHSSPSPSCRQQGDMTEKKQGHRRAKQTELEKVLVILQYLRELNWTVKKLLKAIVRNGSHRRIQQAKAQVLDTFYVDLPQESEFSQLITSRRSSSLLLSWGRKAMAVELSRELQDLVKTPTFGKYAKPSQEMGLGSLDFVTLSYPSLQSVAPAWLQLFQTAYSSTRRQNDQPSLLPPSTIVPIWQIAVIGILCHAISPYTSTNLQTIIGLYLYHGGARRRVIETFNHLGLCVSYSTIQKRLEVLVEDAARVIQEVGPLPTSIVTYDNFEFTEGRRGERIGDTREFRSITTALMFEGRNIPSSGLPQSTWRPREAPLSSLYIAQRLEETPGPYQQLHLAHLESAIRTLYDHRPEFDDSTFPWHYAIPTLNRIEPRKTVPLPLRPVLKDESTTSNNIFILQNIFRDQFGVNSEAETWSTTLRFVVGDVKTWSRIQSVKALREPVSRHPFERFQWTLPLVGLWHLRFNMLQLIHQIHWGSHHPTDPSTLQFAADHWDRHRVVQANDFQALEDLVIHSYQARVVGTLITLTCNGRQYHRTPHDLLPFLDTATNADGLTWDQILSSISQRLKPPLPAMNPVNQAPETDEEFQNHRHFCSHVEDYLTLRFAIKYGDIGLLRIALRRVMILFQAPEAKTPKHASALLSIIHLIDSPAASEELQNAVLSNSLINLQGKPDTFFEVDRLLEQLNNSLKSFQSERSYFAIESDELLQAWALNSPYLNTLKTQVEAHLGRFNSPFHPRKPEYEDIWSLALLLAPRSLQQVHTDRFSMNATKHLFFTGLNKLGENVSKYNRRNSATDDLTGAVDEVSGRDTALSHIESQLDDPFEEYNL